MKLPRPNVIERWWLTIVYVTIVLVLFVILYSAGWFA